MDHISLKDLPYSPLIGLSWWSTCPGKFFIIECWSNDKYNFNGRKTQFKYVNKFIKIY